MKIALVMCPSWGREAPPLSISLLGSNLRRRGHETYLFDLSNLFYHKALPEYKKYWGQEYYSYWGRGGVNDFIKSHGPAVDEALRNILDTKARIIGFSLVFTSNAFSLEMASLIKQRSPDTIVIMGGPQASYYYSGKEIISDENVDAIFLHEADETLPRALDDFEKQGYFSKTPGLVFKKDGQIVDGGMPEPIPSLDNLPFADYSDFDLRSYANPHRLDIFCSRSCINHCHYCDERNYFQRYRYRSGRNLYDEIVYQLKRNPSVTFFNFSDSVLNGSIEAIRELCQLLIKNHVNIAWGGQAVIRKEMTRELLELMRAAGCAYLSYGIESGSDKVLQSMNKRLFTVDLASTVMQNTHESHINAYANFMFGFPTETEADFLDTLKFIKQNRKWIDGVSPSQAFMVILRNTYLYDHLAEFNIGPNPHHEYWKTMDGLNTYPVRFKRYELFCKLCIEMKLTGVGVTTEKIDKWRRLGAYYEHEQEYGNAYECYKTDLLQNGFNAQSLGGFEACAEILKISDEARTLVSIFDLSGKKPMPEDVREVLLCAAGHTDDNWLNGVAKSWAAAILVEVSVKANRDLMVGNRLTFADGDTRTITDIREEGSSLIVFLDGDPMDGAMVGYPHTFTIYGVNKEPAYSRGAADLKSYLRVLANRYWIMSVLFRVAKRMRDIWGSLFSR
jgi:anaerobic magnesium-protoporphyrin IX monomethyl ester cyclase